MYSYNIQWCVCVCAQTTRLHEIYNISIYSVAIAVISNIQHTIPGAWYLTLNESVVYIYIYTYIQEQYEIRHAE